MTAERDRFVDTSNALALKRTPRESETEWLTLDQASKRLGVHPTTLRRWANSGAIDVFLTAGGHRRFRLADLERFEREHHRSRLPTTLEQQWADCAIARTRQSLAHQSWVVPYGEAERQSYRQLGRRLVGLLLQYVSRSDESVALLAEARSVGQQHAINGLQLGQSLVDLLQAVSFFRTTMLEVAILQLPDSTKAEPETSILLLRRIERILDEVQVGVVGFYLGGGQT